MSGTIAILLASLLSQQAAPHPSTLEPYRPPAVRPFQPDSDFGREKPQGDATPDLARAPLTGPSWVDGYSGAYEFTPTEAEAGYVQAVATRRIEADATAGPLDGAWRLSTAEGQALVDVYLSDPGEGRIEGAWRGARARGWAPATIASVTLEGLGEVVLWPDGDGWRGELAHLGRRYPVRLTRLP